ncbi:hypothetical protein LIER_24720 [Lithospermum erythrorhizon]|uniref:Uncharacterized protein n=1 Tax=Lithospermum erythrorhizon TaxID=34254 RepID=A0AAV3R4D8_LITER
MIVASGDMEEHGTAHVLPNGLVKEEQGAGPDSTMVGPITSEVTSGACELGSEPKSFKEAMNDPGWREAMHREIRALEDNGT